MEIHDITIGTCVKIKSDNITMPWYSKKIFRVTKIIKNRLDDFVIVVSPVLNVKLQQNRIHPEYVFRDSDCVQLERRMKLNKINE